MWIFLAAGWAWFRDDRETPAGAEAAAHWLGVRNALGADPQFGSLPPAAVAIWNRMLAYGAGLDIARAAVRSLPFGAEDPHHAWSPYGGAWRFVRIRRFHRPGWGQTRGEAFWGGIGRLVQGAFLTAIPVVVAGFVMAVAFNIGARSTAGGGTYRNIPPLALIILGAVALPGLTVLAGGVLRIANSVWSLGPHQTVEGTVLRSRAKQQTGSEGDGSITRTLVLDDGRSAVLDVWPVMATIKPDSMEEGSCVRVSALRRLCCVVGVERLDLPSPGQLSSPQTPTFDGPGPVIAE